jgi:putative transcriptional regulator
MPGRAPPPARAGLAALRRSGAVSDLLFLYECETREVGQLRSIAERLGLSVQAASHTFRSLRRRGLVELRGGRYKPTVRGVDWLHGALGQVRDDLAERLDRLHIVRTTRAIATDALKAGDAVILELRDGVLLARPGHTQGSRGRSHGPARAGDLVEIGELEGIVPLPRGRVHVLPLPSARLADPTLARQVRAAVERRPNGLLLAYGLEGYHVLTRARTFRPVVRFGVAAALEEATRIGVDCLLVVADRDLPRLFEKIEGPDVPEFEFVSLSARGSAPGARR